jgi:iron complex transport system permease protein
VALAMALLGVAPASVWLAALGLTGAAFAGAVRPWC